MYHNRLCPDTLLSLQFLLLMNTSLSKKKKKVYMTNYVFRKDTLSLGYPGVTSIWEGCYES